MPQLTLYYRDTCPYCLKVLRFLQENNIQLARKNTQTEPRNRQELMKIGGKGQVPCLVIDGRALYESEEIIQWLKTYEKGNAR